MTNLLIKLINYFKRKIFFFICIKLFKNKKGLEIGGPSEIFEKANLLPIYSIIKGLDNCNFSTNTIWEGKLKEGKTFIIDNKKENRKQFISEATDLSQIPPNTYEFVLASHILEHIANPLKALKEWLRVIRNNGLILIVVPNKSFMFDHRRSISSFDHLLSDYKSDIKEDNLTHLNEILKYHDITMDSGVNTFKEFEIRSKKNFKYRALHHHVFDINLLINMFKWLGLKKILTVNLNPFHLIILGQKKIV